MRSTCGFAAGGEDEAATLRKLGKRVSAIRFAYLGCRTARVRSRSLQDLSPSDSDLSQLGWRRGSHSGFREGDSRRSDRRPDRAKPQVTRVIGVFDPYTIVGMPARNALVAIPWPIAPMPSTATGSCVDTIGPPCRSGQVLTVVSPLGGRYVRPLRSILFSIRFGSLRGESSDLWSRSSESAPRGVAGSRPPLVLCLVRPRLA